MQQSYGKIRDSVAREKKRIRRRMRIVPTAFLINKSEGPFGPFFSAGAGAKLAGRTSTSRFLVVRLLCHAPPAIVLKCSREWDQRAGQPSICYEVGGGVVFF